MPACMPVSATHARHACCLPAPLTSPPGATRRPQVRGRAALLHQSAAAPPAPPARQREPRARAGGWRGSAAAGGGGRPPPLRTRPRCCWPRPRQASPRSSPSPLHLLRLPVPPWGVPPGHFLDPAPPPPPPPPPLPSQWFDPDDVDSRPLHLHPRQLWAICSGVVVAFRWAGGSGGAWGRTLPAQRSCRPCRGRCAVAVACA